MGIIIYMILGYLAARYTVYANKIMIGSWLDIHFRILFTGFVLGFFLIPWAAVKFIISLFTSK